MGTPRWHRRASDKRSGSWRRRGLALAVGLLLSGLAPPGPARAAGGADLSIAGGVTSVPDQVWAPVGGSSVFVLYNLVVTNTGGRTISSFVVTDTLPAGTTFAPAQSSPGCAGGGGGKVTCKVTTPLAPGASNAADPLAVVAEVPTAGINDAVTVTDKATITSSSPKDTNSKNNTGSATTTVHAPLAECASSAIGCRVAGVVPDDASLAAGLHVLSSPGAVVVDTLAIEPPRGSAFEQSVRVVFANDNPDLTNTDRTHPVRLVLNMPPREPCRGLGGPCPLHMDKPGFGTDLVVPLCPGPGGSAPGAGVIPPDLEPAVCIDEQSQTNAITRYVVLLLTEDPGFY